MMCCVVMSLIRMAIRVILVLTLFTGLSVAYLKGNIALNARVVQSSLYQADGIAEHAVDGNRNADYGKGSCTHTKSELNPWWRADLGNVYSISKVAITNRGDCCKDRLRGAQIRIGNNLENNGNNNELVATILTVPDGTKTFEFEPVNGRYVNILLPGNNEILTLCEVEVFAEEDKPLYICVPRNLALGGNAVQSTTYSNLGVAHNAVDGNRQSSYALGSCSVTNGDRDPWWRVDLLNVYRITRVSITNRGDCCEKRIRGIQIRIGNSLENNGNNNQLAATVGPIPLGNTKTFEFKPLKGRYVNLIVPGRAEYLTLCEVEVYSD
uniref:Fucolectin tachylectin-4 pentraxin-1 domain-containing protein n=1 Tax=Cyprinus carpio carpio TaxID=630221 RepID=A0A9J7Y5A9_CYPCA